MSKRTRVSLILFALSFIVGIFSYSMFYSRSQFIEYKKDIENDLSRVSLFCLKSKIYDFGSSISDYLRREDISLSNLEYLSRAILEKSVFLLWMDLDGNVVAEFGDVPDEDLYSDVLVQSVLYEDSYVFFADLYPLNETLQMRTAMVVESVENDEFIVLVGKALSTDDLAEIESLVDRRMTFISKDSDTFKEVLPVSTELVKKVTGSQNPEAEITKDGKFISVVPFLDFEEWETKGFLVNSIDLRQSQNQFLRVLTVNVILFGVSSLILIFGILNATRKRLKAMMVLLLCSVPLFVSILYVFVFQIPKTLENEYTEYVKVVAKALERFGTTWMKIKDFDEMKRILGLQVILEKDKDIVSSTLKKNLLDRLTNWKPMNNLNEVEMGELDVNRVRHTYVALKQQNETLYLLKEKTTLVNTRTGIRFMGIIVLLVSTLFAVVLGFSIKNADRPRFLRATLIGYLFLAPALIHLLWWAAGPVVFSFYLAFQRWNVVDPAKPLWVLKTSKNSFRTNSSGTP